MQYQLLGEKVIPYLPIAKLRVFNYTCYVLFSKVLSMVRACTHAGVQSVHVFIRLRACAPLIV